MSDETLTKIWSAVALAALYFSINGILDVQGSSYFLPFIVELSEKRSRAEQSIFWFVLAVLPYLVTLYLSRGYLARHASRSPLSSWPVLFGFALDLRERLARRYQQCWLVVLILIPAWGCGFLLREVLRLQIYERDSPICLAEGLNHLIMRETGLHYIAVDGEELRRQDEMQGLKARCDNPGTNELKSASEKQLRETRDARKRIGVDYVPIFEPWLFVLLVGAVAYHWVRLLLALWNRRAQSSLE